MKVIDLINSSKSTAFSFEILPPLKGNSIKEVSHQSRIGRHRFGYPE